jgi:apolipoprotein D and lipocalin family protein
LAPDYSTTTIGYPSRDLIWIMARTPTLPESTYQSLLQKAGNQGYDTSRIVRVPQKMGL